MTSILLRLILMSSINSTQIEAGIASNISTTEEATTTRISTLSAGESSNHVPEWLKGFVRRDNLTSAYLFHNHNLTVLPARSFALWPETQVRKYHSIHCSSIIFHYGMDKQLYPQFLCGVTTHYPKFNGALAKPPLRVGYGWVTWWRHQMETFSALLALCAGNSPVPGEFPTQRPVTRSFDVFFDVRVWVNPREAGDLRRYHIHYDVIVMGCNY